jgi:SAM-dependent methyltransferase
MADPDVYGAELADLLSGGQAMEIVERDDGFLMVSDGRYQIAPFRRWDDRLERRSMRFVRGRVLDVGCGAGRVCLHLQGRGLDVVGIDSSPGAVACSRRRGVHDVRLMELGAVDASLGRFDTIVFLGQNFGMLGSIARGRRLLRRLHAISTERGRIVAEMYDPHRSDHPAERRYRQRNVERGRMAGQLRIRLRYRHMATAWQDWLQLSIPELERLLDGTGWRLSRTLGAGPSYVAIIDRGVVP